MIIDVQVGEPHFLNHIAPVWNALDPCERGQIYAQNNQVSQRAAELGMNAISSFPGIPVDSDAVRLVASWGDLKRVRNHGKPIVFMEHGAGFTFSARHESYAGGLGRDNVSLFLCPNEQTARSNRRYYPDIPAVVIGCPKLDNLKFRPPIGRRVCISFHWPARVCPETNWTFPEYRNALRTLAKDADCELIGHGHPRVWPRLHELYTRLGIEPVADFDEALEKCDLYVHDSGSTLYESAAAGRGVVAMNSRFYRRDIDHGLRFWRHVPGPQVDTTPQLAPTVKRMLDGGWTDWEDIRQDAVIAAYGPWGMDGGAAKRAVTAIRSVLG